MRQTSLWREGGALITRYCRWLLVKVALLGFWSGHDSKFLIIARQNILIQDKADIINGQIWCRPCSRQFLCENGYVVASKCHTVDESRSDAVWSTE